MTLRTEVPPPSPDITSVMLTPCFLKKPLAIAIANVPPDGSALYWVTTTSSAPADAVAARYTAARTVPIILDIALAPALVLSSRIIPDACSYYAAREIGVSNARICSVAAILPPCSGPQR